MELLRLPAFLMKAITGARNRLYDFGWLPSHRLQMPIVSVGNLTVGGTGKTPMVVWLAKALIERGFRPGVLSRGYRSEEHNQGGEGLNDEGRLFASLLPDVPQVQQPNRVQGATELQDRGCDAIVLDDGFQHRRLARDVDLVLVDATRPWGLPAGEAGQPAVQSILPRGLMRESLESLARASAIVITRSDSVEAESLERLEADLQAGAPGVVRLLAEHRPVRVRRGEEVLELESLRDRPLQVVSGIGNPQAFEATVRRLGAKVTSVHAFADHHPFERSEIEAIAARGEWIATAKDAVKLESFGLPHLVLDVEFAITRGRLVLEALLDSLPLSQRALEREAAHIGLHG